MEKLDILNFRSIALTAFHPIMPLFINTWKSFAYSKWLGIAAKVTYNSNFRNGWVIIDTTIKGTAGTPLLEFSCWESHESRYNIVVPRMMTYKYFFRDKNWRANFIARSSVSQNELWSSRSITYSFLLNGYTHNFFLRNANYLYLLKSLRVLLFTANLLWDYRIFHYSAIFDLFFSRHTYFLNVRGALKNKRKRARFMNRIYALRREHLNFLLFDRFFVIGSSNKNFFLNNDYNYFKHNFFNLFRNTFFKFSVVDPVTSNIAFYSYNNKLSLSSLYFKIFLLVVLFSEMKGNLTLDMFFDILVDSLGRDLAFLFLKRLSVSSSVTVDSIRVSSLETLFKNFFSIFVRKVLLIAELSLISRVKLLMGGVLQFSDSFFSQYGVTWETDQTASNGTKFLLKSYSYKFKQFSLSNLYFLKPKLVVNYFGPNTISLKEFLRYNIRIRRTRRVAYVPRSVFNMPKYPWNRWFRARRRRLQRLRRKQNRLLNKDKLKVKRPWRYICNWSKMALTERRQSVFLIFWALNFFNFNNITTNPKINKDTFYVAIRLVRFFKKFFIFFRFYSFYLNLLRVSIKSNTRFSIFREVLTAGSFKTFLFVLGKRFRKLLVFFRFYVIYLIIKAEKGWTSTLLNNSLVKHSFFNSLKFLNFSSVDKFKDFRIDFNKLNFFSKRDRFVSESAVLPTFLVYKYLNFFKFKTLINRNFFAINSSSMYLNFLLKTRAKFNRLLLRKFSENLRSRPYIKFDIDDVDEFPLLNFTDLVNTWKSAVNSYLTTSWYKNNPKRALGFYRARDLFTGIITHTVEFFLPGLIIDREFKFRKMLYNLFGKYLLSKRTLPLPFNTRQFNTFCASVLEYFIADELKFRWRPITKKWLSYVLKLFRKFADHRYAPRSLLKSRLVSSYRKPKVLLPLVQLFKDFRSLKVSAALPKFMFFFKRFAGRLNSRVVKVFFYNYLRKHKLSLVSRNKYRSKALKLVSSLVSNSTLETDRIDYPNRKRLESFSFFYRDFKFNNFVNKELVPFRYLSPSRFNWASSSRWKTILDARSFLMGYTFVHDKLLVLNTIYPLIRKRYFTPDNDRFFRFSDVPAYLIQLEQAEDTAKVFGLVSHLKVNLYSRDINFFTNNILFATNKFLNKITSDLQWYRSARFPMALMQFTFADIPSTDFWSRRVFDSFNVLLNSSAYSSFRLTEFKSISPSFFNYLNLVGFCAQTNPADEFVDSKRVITEFLNYMFILEQPLFVELFSATLFDLEELVFYFYELGVRYFTYLRLYVFDNVTKLYVKFFLSNLRSFRKRIVHYDSKNAVLDNMNFNQNIFKKYLVSTTFQLQSLLSSFPFQRLVVKKLPLNSLVASNLAVKSDLPEKFDLVSEILGADTVVSPAYMSKLSVFTNFRYYIYTVFHFFRLSLLENVNSPLSVFRRVASSTSKFRRLARVRKLRGFLSTVSCDFKPLVSLGSAGSLPALKFFHFGFKRSLLKFYKVIRSTTLLLSSNSAVNSAISLVTSSIGYNSSVADYSKKYFKLLSSRLVNLDFSDSSILNILTKYLSRFSKDTRAVTPLMFEVYARKRGLYKKPKWWEIKRKRPTNQPKYMSDAYYKRFILGEDDSKKGPRKWKPRVIDYGGGSIFSRTNMASMLLKFDFPEVRFRFVKLFYTWKLRKIKKYFVSKLFSNFAKLGLSTRKLTALLAKIKKVCFLKAKNNFLRNRLKNPNPNFFNKPLLATDNEDSDTSEFGLGNRIVIYPSSADRYRNIRLPLSKKAIPSSRTYSGAEAFVLFNNADKKSSSIKKFKEVFLYTKVLKFLGFSVKKILSDSYLSSTFNSLMVNLKDLCKKRRYAKFHLKWKDSRMLVKHFLALLNVSLYTHFKHNVRLHKLVLRVSAFFFHIWANYLGRRKLAYSVTYFYNLMFLRWLKSKFYKFFLLNNYSRSGSTVVSTPEDILSDDELLKNFKLAFVSDVLKKKRYNRFKRVIPVKKKIKFFRRSRGRFKRGFTRVSKKQNFDWLKTSDKSPYAKFNISARIRRYKLLKKLSLLRKRNRVIGAHSVDRNRKKFKKKHNPRKFVWYSLRPRDFTPYYDKKGKVAFRPARKITAGLDSAKVRLFRLKKSVLTRQRKNYPELYVKNVFRGRRVILALKYFFSKKKNKWFIRYIGLLKSSKNLDFAKAWWLVGNRRRLKKRIIRLRKFRKLKLSSKGLRTAYKRRFAWINYSLVFRQAKNFFNLKRANFLFRKFRLALRKRASAFNNYVMFKSGISSKRLQFASRVPSNVFKLRTLLDDDSNESLSIFNDPLFLTSSKFKTLDNQYRLSVQGTYNKLVSKHVYLTKSKNLIKYAWWLRRKKMSLFAFVKYLQRKRRRNANRKRINEERLIRYELAQKIARLKQLRKERAADRRGLKRLGDKWWGAKAAAIEKQRKAREAREAILEARRKMTMDAWFKRQLRGLNLKYDYTKTFLDKIQRDVITARMSSIYKYLNRNKVSREVARPPFREFRKSPVILRRFFRKRYFRKKTRSLLKKPFKDYYGRWLYRIRRFVQGLSRLLLKTLVSGLLRLIYIYKFQRIMYARQYLAFPLTSVFFSAILNKHNSFILYSIFIKKFFNTLYDKFNRVSLINKAFFLKNAKVAFIFSFMFNFFKKFTLSYFNFSVFYYFSEDFFRSMLKVFFDKIVLYFVKDIITLGQENPFGFFKNFVILNKLLKKNLLDFSSSRINYFTLGKHKENVKLDVFSGHSILNSLFLIWDLRVSKIFLNSSLLQFFYKLNIMDSFNSRGYIFRLRRFKVLNNIKKNRSKGILLREMAYKYPSYSEISKINSSDRLKSIYWNLRGLARLPNSVRKTAKDFPRFGFYWYRVKEWRNWIRKRNKPFLKFFLLYMLRTNLQNDEVPHHVNYGKMPKYPIRSSKNWFFFYKVHESILSVR